MASKPAAKARAESQKIILERPRFATSHEEQARIDALLKDN
ncbi:MAG: hypothetical protein ACREDO_06525 [Methyloceanibacter sp.]